MLTDREYCVRFFSPFDSRVEFDGYVTLVYDSRLARILGWGIDYPGAMSELEFSTRTKIIQEN